MSVPVRVQGGQRFGELAKRLRDAGDKDLLSGLKKAVKDSARPMLADVKSAAQSIPASGSRSSGLRARIAKAAQVQARTGSQAKVRVRISPSKMGEQYQLPRLLNVGSFRHPVFGDTGVWVEQNQGSRGWFFDVGARHEQPTRQRIEGVLDDVGSKVVSGL